MKKKTTKKAVKKTPAKKPVAKATKPSKVTIKGKKKVSVKVSNANHRKQRGRTAPNRAISIEKTVEVQKTIKTPTADARAAFLRDLTVDTAPVAKSAAPTVTQLFQPPKAPSTLQEFLRASSGIADSISRSGSASFNGFHPVAP